MAEEEKQKSVIISDSEYYAKEYKYDIANYWLKKLHGELPIIVAINTNGEYNETAINRIQKIMNDSDWFNIIRKFTYKHSLEGNAALVMHKVIGSDGKPTIKLNVAEGLVRYSQYLGANAYVELIENYARGTVPVIKLTKYGRTQDIISFSTDSNYTYTEDELNSIDDILKTKRIQTHNNGFIRALAYINRPDNETFSFGKSDTAGYEEMLQDLDVLHNKMNDTIKYESTHLAIYLGEGAMYGGASDDPATTEQHEALVRREEEKQSGTVKIHTATIDTADKVSSTIIQGSLEGLKPARSEMQARKTELHERLGIQISYDAKGTTNDTNAKVDKIGDSALQEATIRGNQLSEFLTKIFEIVKLLDEPEYWTNVDVITYKVNINDFRLKVLMMENLKDLIKVLPNEILIAKILGISKFEARKELQAKEDSIKINPSEFAGISNGNFPQQIAFKNLEWSEEKETNETPSSEESENVKDRVV